MSIRKIYLCLLVMIFWGEITFVQLDKFHAFVKIHFFESRSFNKVEYEYPKVRDKSKLLQRHHYPSGFAYAQEDSPLSEQELPPKGERISLHLKGVDIVELFRVLSLKTGITIVPSKGVSGRVNVFLNNITYEDALDIIILSQGLACERQEDVFYIMTGGEYRAIYGEPYIEKRKFKSIKLRYAKPANIFSAISQLKSDIGKIIADEASGTILLLDTPEKLAMLEKAIQDLDKSLTTEEFDLNYAKPEDIKEQLSLVVTPGTGEAIVDERLAKALVTDLPDKLKKIKQIIEALDEESRQVFIEAEIVQVSLSNKYQRGIEWEKIFSEKKLDGLDLVGKFPVSPVLSSYQTISVGTLARDNYNAVLNFLETYGDTKILSRPRIAVVNNQEANIMVGVREAYITQTLSQAEATTVTSESIEFVDVGVKLNVVPTIGKDGFITMEIKPEVSSVQDTITTALGSRIPIVETSEAETVVKVKDGTMIMIAGLMKEEQRDSSKGWPILSRIPLLGILFSSREKETKKTETVVFLTPHLITGAASLPGTEVEKFIPSQIMPEDIKEERASGVLDEIESEIFQKPLD